MKGKELALAVIFLTAIFIFCSNSAYDPWEKDYIIVQNLGGGFFGDTWLLRNETDNEEYVLKKMKSHLSSDNVIFHQSGVREAYFGKKLRNATWNLGKDHIGRFVKHFNDENNLQLISIFEGSQLKRLIYDMDGYTLTQTEWWLWMRTTSEGKLVMKKLIQQLLLGVNFCRENGIVHRDIKPSNIVVCFEKTNGSCRAVNPSHTSNVHLRLIDFGSAVDDFSKKFMYGKSGPTSGEQYLFFMSPESLIDRRWMRYSLSTKYDSWTVGQTILELLLGTPIVFNLTNFEAIWVLKETNYPDDYSFFRTASMAEQCIGLPDAVKLEKMKKLTTCTEDGYADYIRNRDPLHLGFPNVELLRLVRLLLEADPDSRIAVDEALDHPYFASAHVGILYYNIALAFGLIIMVSLSVWYLKVYSGWKKGDSKKKNKKNKKRRN